jgi:hypothetical protein
VAPGKTAIKTPKPFGSNGPAPAGQFIPSVMAAFGQFTAPLEGRLTYAYQDNRGLVTTAAGYLIDPIGTAMALPWQINGQPADPGDVTTQWNLVKSNTEKKYMSVGAKNLPGNTMRLTYAAVDKLTASKATGMTKILLKQFPNIPNWPADAQLGILGVVWGTGPALRSKSASYMAPFVTAIDDDDFLEMADTAHWGNINKDRRSQLILLFTNASYVQKQQGDFTALNWPVRLSDTVTSVGGQAAPASTPAPSTPGDPSK